MFVAAAVILQMSALWAAPPRVSCACYSQQPASASTASVSGIVRDAAVREAVRDEITTFVAGLGFAVMGVMPSPIEGGDGNVEYLIGARRD